MWKALCRVTPPIFTAATPVGAHKSTFFRFLLVTAFKKERIRYDFPVPAPPLKNTLPPDNMMSNAFFCS